MLHSETVSQKTKNKEPTNSRKSQKRANHKGRVITKTISSKLRHSVQEKNHLNCEEVTGWKNTSNQQRQAHKYTEAHTWWEEAKVSAGEGSGAETWRCASHKREAALLNTHWEEVQLPGTQEPSREFWGGRSLRKCSPLPSKLPP